MQCIKTLSNFEHDYGWPYGAAFQKRISKRRFVKKASLDTRV